MEPLIYEDAMLTLLSPAKSLDYESPLRTKKHTNPRLSDHTQRLAEIMATKTPDQLVGLMGISADLAHLNYERFQDWDRDPRPDESRAAILAFNGDVYQAMARNTFDERDFTHAQKNLRILSGLYGLLRPLDTIQPHRLEMSTRLETERGNDLYSYWGSSITEMLRDDLSSRKVPVVINLASAEYARAVQFDDVGAPVVTPRFKDLNRGEYRVVGLFAKRARGLMAGWMIQNRVKSRRGLRAFDVGGYQYSPADSTSDSPTFLRDAAA